MPPIIKITEENNLVETSKYPYAKWVFEKFNPIQSALFPYYDKEMSGVVATKTSSGKTVCAEMFLAHEVRKRGGKGLYLAPMRALAQEKIDDWTNPDYHFGDLKVAICTGDYRLTKERKQELEEADLIIMTTEMLNARIRNFKSEHNEFLLNIGTCVVDEGHLLTVPGRGAHLEVGLCKFSQICPKARIILLSATMPNVNEIGEWMSYVLTKQETFVLTSEYRPCPLNVHYEIYQDSGRYDEKEMQKVDAALDIVEDYPDDKFLIFAHTKKTGELMKKCLASRKIQSEFHSASVEKDKRVDLERRFKTDPSFRVLVATSTLAWGCNVPARRVIILGMERGLDEVPTYDIWQMVGRSGRPAYDPIGDAYILIPETDKVKYKTKLQNPQKIISQLLEQQDFKYKGLAFHLISEIHHGLVQTKEDIQAWYERTLANFQARDLDDTIIDSVVDSLKEIGAIRLEDDIYKATSVGMIASMFYYSPYDVSDLRKNFKRLFENNQQNDDYQVAMALGNTDTFKSGIISKAEKEEMESFAAKAKKLGMFKDQALKAGYGYYCLLNGVNTYTFISMMRGMEQDYPRLNQVLKTLDTMGGKWEKTGWFETIARRIQYGVKPELLDLCGIDNVGRVRAQKLFSAGYKNACDIASGDSKKLSIVLGMKPDSVQKMIDSAKLSGA